MNNEDWNKRFTLYYLQMICIIYIAYLLTLYYFFRSHK